MSVVTNTRESRDYCDFSGRVVDQIDPLKPDEEVMPRKSKPRFCRSRNEWVVNFKSRRYYRDTREEAEKLLKLLEAQQVDSSIVIPPRRESGKQVTGETTLFELCDAFLGYKEPRLAESTLENHRKSLVRLCDNLGDNFPAAQLTESVVIPFIADEYSTRTLPSGRQKPYSSHTRHSVFSRIREITRWGSCPQHGLLSVDPLQGVRNPFDTRTRERVLTDMEFSELMAYLAAMPDGLNFSDLINFIAMSGCRVNEAITADCEFVIGNQIVFPTGQKKGLAGRKRQKRVIRIPAGCQPMIDARVARYKTGRIFRNSKDEPWTSDAINNRIVRMTSPRKNDSSPSLSFDFNLTCLRHTWCTKYLKSGGTIPEAAALMGHCNTRMVSEVYSHIAQDEAHLESKVDIVTYGAATPSG